MSKNKPVEDDLALPLDSFQDVELQRKWYVAQPMGAPLVGIILAKSKDVSSVFRNDKDKGDDDEGPKYVYAVELRAHITKESESLSVGQEPAEGKPGDVVYLFEPKTLKDFLTKCHEEGKAFAIFPIGKRKVESRRLGKKIEPWQWKAKELNQPVKAITPLSAVMLPTPDEDALPAIGE